MIVPQETTCRDEGVCVKMAARSEETSGHAAAAGVAHRHCGASPLVGAPCLPSQLF
jgi:hypothetical protein